MIAADKGGKLPTEIQVLPLGEWETIPYGRMVITTDHLSQIVANFNAGIRKAVPVDVDHNGGMAAGWINSLEAKEDGLYATVDWNSYGQDLLTEKKYKLFSPEWSFEYRDPEKGTQHGAVLVAGSLTNRPLFKELDFIVASDGSKKTGDLTKDNGIMLILGQDNIMKLSDLIKKAKKDLSAEELKFIKENADKLSDEDKKKFADDATVEETPEAKAEREKKEKEEADAEKAKKDEEAAAAEKVAKEKEAEEAKKANEGGDKDVTIKASELVEFKKAQEANAKRVIADKVGEYVANEKGGKILPKSKDAVIAFAMTCNDSQKEAFYSVLSELPEIKVAGEAGSDENSHLTASDKITKLIEDKKNELQKANEKLTDGEAEAKAQKIIQTEKPELWEEYNKSL